ncbi:MAG: protein kinase domain-containing protein [Planctomycetota bacterium]
MPSRKDAILGKLAVERGYLTQERLDQAFHVQRKMRDELGMDESLEQVLVGKKWLTADQTQELRHAAAVQTGEARLVAGYEAVSKLGQGGMGAVYKARCVGTDEFVALKVLPPSLADKEMIARFTRESEIVRKLHHANIVGCIEFGFDKRKQCYFCALELVDGEDLGKYLRRKGRLLEDEAVSITSQIAGALQHAYFHGLVHRDVKPENIMVTLGGTVKLLDLGLARPANQEATRLTESGMFVGSPYYASPEQAVGEKEVDTRSDIYSLGATLYHMVTGKPPCEGTTALAILRRHVTEKLPWPAEVNPELSDGLCRIIAKMMEKSPDDRYQKPNDLHRDLDLLVEGEEPGVDDAGLKNSSIKVPAVRPKRRRRPAARARHGKHPDRGRRDSAREHRGGVPDRRRGRSGVPAGVKIGIAAVAGVVVAAVLASLFVGKGQDGGPPGPETPKRQPEPTVQPPSPEPPKPGKRRSKKRRPEPRSKPVKKRARGAKPKEDPFAKLRRDSDERMAGPAAAAPAGGAASFGGHRYKLYKKKIGWPAANAFCEKQGGHLVTITSKEENDFVTGLARQADKDVWIGLTDEREEGKWRWITGEEVVLLFWGGGQPDDYQDGQDYGRLARKYGLAWDDDYLRARWGFICEWEPGETLQPVVAAAADLTRALVGHWTFDEGRGMTARDSSGKGRHGAVKGGAKWATGKFRGALGFDGKDDYVSVGAAVNLGRSGYAVSAWFKTDNAAQQTILAATKGPSGHAVLLELGRGGKLRYLHRWPAGNDGGTNLYSKRSYRDGRWHHVVAVKAGADMTLYLDGGSVGTARDTRDLGSVLEVVIGRISKATSDRLFLGSMDEVRIYDRGLSAAEVKALAGSK